MEPIEQENSIDSNLAGVLDGKYNLIKKVGSGGTSSVYIGYDKTDEEKTIRAIKLINPKKQDSKFFRNEVDMLKKVSHENVVKIIEGGEGTFKKSDGRSKFVNYIVLEYIKNGELFDFIFFPQKGFGEDYGRVLFLAILEGLEACHQAGIAHRDLKTENIMVTEDFQVKIADFGFAALKEGRDGKGLLYTSLGTPNYAAPELHSKSPYYGICNDIFSLAVTLFVIVTGSMPFKQATSTDPFYSYVIKNDYEGYWAKRGLKQKLSYNFKSLLFNLIAFDYAQRPTIDEVRQHPWLQELSGMDIDSLKLKLRDDFYKRKQIVDFKRAKEKADKEEEKNAYRKVPISKAYRSFDKDSFIYTTDEAERSLEKYFDYGNRYTISFSQEANPKTLLKILKNFFEDLQGEVTISKDKYSMKILLPAIDESEEYFSNNLDNLVASQDLKMLVEIRHLEDDQIIIDFNKRSGDRLRFYKIYQHFFDSLN